MRSLAKEEEDEKEAEDVEEVEEVEEVEGEGEGEVVGFLSYLLDHNLLESFFV